VPKSPTSSVAKTGFVVSLVSPTFRLNPSPTPLPQTQPPLAPQLDPDQNPTSAHLHCLRTPTGALLSSPTTDTPKLTSLPRVSPPPYQVSFTALPPPLSTSPMSFDRSPFISFFCPLKPRTAHTSPRSHVSAYTPNRLSTHSICQPTFLSNCSTTVPVLPSFHFPPIPCQIYPLDSTPPSTTPCPDRTTLACSRAR
jgi:hypothetical protein